jgi:hypothetical protein
MRRQAGPFAGHTYRMMAHPESLLAWHNQLCLRV